MLGGSYYKRQKPPGHKPGGFWAAGGTYLAANSLD
jgi:hypothetical protein